MRQIKNPDLQLAESRRNYYVATISAGTLPDELTVPLYWAQVAGKLRVLDKIACWWEDGTRYCELLVVRASAAEAQCVGLLSIELATTVKGSEVAKELANYDVTYAGPSIGYRVVRKSDGHVIRADVAWTQERAMAWLYEYLAQPASSRPPAAIAADQGVVPEKTKEQLAVEARVVREPPKSKAA